MDLHHLWLFYKVAQNLSFTKTAEELFISQPTISVQVKKLEEDIDLKLIEKYGKNIYLTQYGKMVYKYAEKIFSLVDDMESEISLLKGKMSGNLNIGASNTPGTYLMPEIIGVFKEKHPDVKINLHIGSTYDIQNMLSENRIDFAVTGGPINLPKSFNVEKLGNDSMVLIMSPNHPLARHSSLDAGMLSEHGFVVHEPTSNLYDAVEDIITKGLRIPMNVSMTLGNIAAIKNAVCAGLGVSIVPLCSVRQDVSLGLLHEAKVEGKEWKYSFSLVYHKDKNLTLPIKMMIRTIKDKMQELFK